MCDLLGDVTAKRIFEPCVGSGALLENLIGVPESVEAVDIDPGGFELAKIRFPHDFLKLHHEDFFSLLLNFDTELLRPCFASSPYDAVIANPPYGLSIDKGLRSRLKKMYPDLYVKESYSLFLIFSVLLLREGGRYVFIVPDSFLASTNHRSTRAFLAREARPTHIVRFPSKRFGSINFGYGGLCIIAGNKGALQKDLSVSWSEFDATENLTRERVESKGINLTGAKLLSSVIEGWNLHVLFGQSLEQRSKLTLNDVAECKTGIYTGDNLRFIGFDLKRIKRKLNGHPINWSQQVEEKDLSLIPGILTTGLPDSGKSYVPLVRGGHREAFEKPSSAIMWTKDAVDFYIANDKARFQNSSFYFREGLAVPMVSSSRLSASYMNQSVFDQGVVGVFPKEQEMLDYLLLYLNSDLATTTLKAIVNGHANNSANYLKRLPIPFFCEQDLIDARAIIQKARDQGVKDLRNTANHFFDGRA